MAEVLVEPTNEQAIQIKRHLGEDPGRLEHNLKLFTEWIESQSYLPEKFDKRMLPTFLRGCKHNLHLAKRKFQMHFSAKNSVPEIFCCNPNSIEMTAVPEQLYIATLPDLTPDGNRITVFKLKDPDLGNFDMIAGLQFITMIFDIRLYEDQLYGSDIFIFEGEHFTAAHAAKFVNVFLKRIVTVARVGYPFRVAGIHVVNAPLFAEMLMRAVRPYMHEKIRSRFVLHKSAESLQEYFPADILPKELGGVASSLGELTKRWHKCLVNHAEWWKKQQQIRCAGPIPKALHSCALEDTIGVTGSFRKLEID